MGEPSLDVPIVLDAPGAVRPSSPYVLGIGGMRNMVEATPYRLMSSQRPSRLPSVSETYA
jgi:hypothetical protein